MRGLHWAEMNWRLALGVILLAGFVLRLAWALVIPMEPVSDSHAYHVFAVNMVEHGVYGWTPEQPGAYWAVGTSAIVAALYAIFGQDFGPIVVLNLIISMAVIAQVFVLSRHFLGTAAGLMGALLMALWPSMILYVTILASEIFFLFFVLGGLMAFVHHWQRWWVGVLVAGLFWAAATYIRPVAVLLPLVYGFGLIVQDGRIGARLGQGLTVALIMAIAIAPWTYRNYTIFGKPVLISTNFGANFWMGNNPETTGGYMPTPERTRHLSETERSAALQREAMDYIRAEPSAFVLRTIVKFLRLHERETIAVHWNGPPIERQFGQTGFTGLKLAATGYWYAVLLLALGGLVHVVRRLGLVRAFFHPVVLSWSYFAAVHAVIVTGDRYHFPSIPAVAILAGLALAGLAGRHPPDEHAQTAETA